MTERPVLSAVTPVYDEQEIVPELVSRIVASCRPLGVTFEVVVVNDGSRDAGAAGRDQRRRARAAGD